MAELFDWNKAVADTFPNAERTPWISIPANGFYEGTIRMLKGGLVNKFGTEIIEVWFMDGDMERHFDAGVRMAQQLQMLNVQVGDTIKISKLEVPGLDKAGNPLLTPEGKPVIYSNYNVEVTNRSDAAAPEATKKADPANAGEINIDDIPF